MNPNATQPQADPQAARRDFLDTLLRVFDSADGQSILAWIRTATGIARPAHTPGGTPHDAIWRDGRRSIGLELEAILAEARNPAATGKRGAKRPPGTPSRLRAQGA